MISPYYQEDGITLYCGDCREILPQFPRDSVDAVVTDPPWNMGYFVDDEKTWEEYVHWLESLKIQCQGIADGQVWFLSTKQFHIFHHFFADTKYSPR